MENSEAFSSAVVTVARSIHHACPPVGAHQRRDNYGTLPVRWTSIETWPITPALGAAGGIRRVLPPCARSISGAGPCPRVPLPGFYGSTDGKGTILKPCSSILAYLANSPRLRKKSGPCGTSPPSYGLGMFEGVSRRKRLSRPRGGSNLWSRPRLRTGAPRIQRFFSCLRNFRPITRRNRRAITARTYSAR